MTEQERYPEINGQSYSFTVAMDKFASAIVMEMIHFRHEGEEPVCGGLTMRGSVR